MSAATYNIDNSPTLDQIAKYVATVNTKYDYNRVLKFLIQEYGNVYVDEAGIWITDNFVDFTLTIGGTRKIKRYKI